MANTFIKPQKGLIENILWKRVINTDDKRKSDRGAIVIDPNKVMDENGVVSDRYIKQEDLTIYAELKVFKKPEYSVIKDNEKTTILPNNDFITINMLNPLQKNATNTTKAQYKNKLTTQWSEFFTNNITNNPLSESFIVDPETFGISSIDIAINADFQPTMTITFIDIQGRTLFERGNDENNPYNIFFTYPYPKFVLKYKGYYGKTVETQLVLIQSNYRFDPNTGNYTITCNFQSEVFSLLNSILIIYAYAAPYMFATSDGDYLGNKILKKLYENQNKELANQFGSNSNKYSKLEILGAPKLTNLARALQSIQYDSIINNSDNLNNEEDNNNLLRIKYFIESNVELIRANFNDTTVYTKERDSNNSLYLYKIIDKPDNGIFDQVTANCISDINNELKKITSLSQYNNYTNNINKFYGSVKTYQPKPDINNILTEDIFKFKNSDSLFLDNFNNIITLVDLLLDDILKEIEDKSYDITIKNIKDSLKYEPNLSNVVRIISNNIQTFLLLMRIVSEMAINQIEKDGLRQLIQDKNTTVVINKNQSKIYSAFPNYYESKKRNLNGEDVEMNVQVYPGKNTATDDWFEVQFVEEFYNAIGRLHKEMGGADQNNLFGNKKTGIISVFCLGNSNYDDLSVYEDKKKADDIMLELFKKYTLHLMYSGFIYRSNNLSDYANSMANYEIGLIDDNVIDTITSINQKYLLASIIKKYTDKNEFQNNLTSFGYSFFNVKKNDADTYKKETINEIKLYKSKFSEEEFDEIINKKNAIITNNKFAKLYNTTSPKLYSIGLENGKQNKTSIIPDLKYNTIYYSDKYPEPFNNSLNSSEDANLIQGFLKDLNKKLNTIAIDTNFTSAKVSFDDTTVNTLTFSSTADDIILNKAESINNVFDIYKEI